MSVAAVAALTLLLPGASLCQEAPHRFPREGVVSHPSGHSLTVRVGPPTATAFTYELQPEICALGPGSRFKAVDEVHIINGEIWYRIVGAEPQPVAGGGCPPQGTSGWMIGKFPWGWAVSFVSKDLEQLPPKPQAPSTPQRAREPGFGFAVRYFSLVAGTWVAVSVLAIRRKQQLHPRTWFSGPLVVEGLVLTAANAIFAALLLDVFIEREDSSVLAQFFAIFARRKWGFALLGFVLSIVLARFVGPSEEG